MRSWLLYIAIVIAALVALLVLTNWLPAASSAVFSIGTPVIVIGSGLGAKYVKERLKGRRTHQR